MKIEIKCGMQRVCKAAIALLIIFILFPPSAFCQEFSPRVSSKINLGKSIEDIARRSEEKIINAEVRKLDAERIKLELEAKQIERSLNAKWWEGQKLTEYFVAIGITAGLLFAWTLVYLQPILRKETEINKLAEQRNKTLNELLEIKNEEATKRQQEAEKQRDDLGKKRDLLETDIIIFKKMQNIQKATARGLEIRLEELFQITGKGSGKFFSILDAKDPIANLKNLYGWEMWSDNYWGSLGYYLIIKHPVVRSGKHNIVCRSLEIDDLKNHKPNHWREEVERAVVNSRCGPILALDNSYFGILVDEKIPVGGILYREGGNDVPFYEPLSQWSEKLSALFPDE
jgi:hypothetical protein